MEKLKLRDDKVSWTQCNFLSVNQLIFKLFVWTPSPDLQGPPRRYHMFLIWTFTIPPLLHSTPSTKLNCSGFPEMVYATDLCSQSITLASIIKCPKLNSEKRPGSDIPFSMDNNLLSRKWLFNSLHCSSHSPTNTESFIPFLWIKVPPLFSLLGNTL